MCFDYYHIVTLRRRKQRYIPPVWVDLLRILDSRIVRQLVSFLSVESQVYIP